MITPDLHKKPVGLDREKHKNLKLRRELSNLRAAAGLNALFLTGAEFGDACAYLCSAQAGFITGQNMVLDGGAYPGTF